MGKNLKDLPSVNEVLRHESVARLLGSYPRFLVLGAVRDVICEERERIRTGAIAGIRSDPGTYAQRVNSNLDGLLNPKIRNVVNCTGVIIHTNLGRSVLSAQAIDSLKSAAGGCLNLEFDLETGRRSSRNEHVGKMICLLTGAEDSIIVNNNAAAVLLALSSLAQKKEVLISRGEIVEIGGNFRINEILKASGARIKEVGTTNKTRIADYKAAVNPKTGAILKVHPSNYRIIGFKESACLRDLTDLGRNNGIPVIFDAGSGLLFPVKGLGKDEPLISEALKTGADLVTFSADKLLGGPQAGIIAGKRSVITKLKNNPLYRALRVCKLSVAALQGTLKHYLRGDFSKAIPVIEMIERPVSLIEKNALCLRDELRRIDKDSFFKIEVKKGRSYIGAGSFPGLSLETRTVSLAGGINPSKAASILRKFDTPVIARVDKNELLLDLRTILKHEMIIISKAFEFLLNNSRCSKDL